MTGRGFSGLRCGLWGVWVMGCVWVVVVGFWGAWGRVVSVVAFVVWFVWLFLFWQRVQFYIHIFVALFMRCTVLRWCF